MLIKKNTVEDVIIYVFLVLFALTPFYISFGLKWHLILLLFMLLKVIYIGVVINQKTIAFLCFSLYYLLLYIYSEISIHFNLFMSNLAIFSLYTKKTNFSARSVILTSVTFLGILLYTDHYPGLNYVDGFNQLNEVFGANRASFVFFTFAIFLLYDQGVTKSYFLCLLASTILTARFHIIGSILALLSRVKVIHVIVVILSLSMLTYLVMLYLDLTWMLWFYLFKIDTSVFVRFSKIIQVFIDYPMSVLIPVTEYMPSVHFWPSEFLAYSGAVGLPYLAFVLLSITPEKRILFVIYFIFLSSAKTVHDLPLYHIALVWFLLPSRSSATS